MDPMTPKAQLGSILGKYKYPLAVLIIGLGLMLLFPSGGGDPETASEPPVQQETRDLTKMLEALLSQIQGAGEVLVILTEESGQEILYQTDTDSSAGENGSNQSSSTVIVEDSERTETGLIRQTLEPKYRGAVIVCQGGDDPSVRLSIVEAVRCATGLGADSICVLKMK